MAGRVVFITGGSRGLGLELARVFGDRGARVAICAREPDELERAHADLRRRGITALAIPADVSVQAEIAGAIGSVERELGPIDILVNNAGTIQVGPMEAATLDDYRSAMDTHFWAMLYAVEAVLPAMRARRSGRIVNVTSIGGRVSVPHLLPYCASKFAAVGYSEGLRAELRRDGIAVTTVVPGLMRTGSHENAFFKSRNVLEYAWFSIASSLPLLSVDVTAAAREIADAAERGAAGVTISIPAKLLALAHGIAPDFVTDVQSVVARLLPPYGGIGTSARRGRDSHSLLSPSPVTALQQRRAETQNQQPA
jgi:NAD(P)-dependent dehydrogenase (short-subunit alcohol dehydrogenase family)